MTDISRRTRSGRRPGGGAPAPIAPSRPYILRNTLRPLEILSEAQIDAIETTAYNIAADAGMRFDSSAVRQTLRSAGCQVDDESHIVKFSRDVIDSALKTLPTKVSLTPRNSDKRVDLSGDAMAFCLTSGPPFVTDGVRGRRNSSFKDYRDLIRLAQHFDIIHMLGIQVAPPQDLPVETRHLDCMLANLTETDKAYGCFTIGTQRAEDAIEMAAIARGISREDLKASPSVYTMCPVNSPRVFDEGISDGLTVFAKYRQPIIIDPFCLLGAMAPVSLMGGLSQQHAEALCVITLTQVIEPGAPVIYGPLTSNVDMRSGSPAFGTPEHARIILASGQLARRLRLPFRSSNVNSSNSTDAQSMLESAMATLSSVMGGTNLLYHGAGWLEGGMSVSYEKLILDVEMLQMVATLLQPIDERPEEFALDAIKGVAPGGHYFGETHTQSRYQTAFYEPLVCTRKGFEDWDEAGRPTAESRATAIWQGILRDFQPPPIDDAIRARLEDYVDRRKEEGSGAA